MLWCVVVLLDALLTALFSTVHPQAFTYCLTYLFKSHSTAQTVVLLVNLFCMVLLIAAFVMGFIDSTCKANQGLMYLYKCGSPPLSLSPPCSHPGDCVSSRLVRFMPGFALGNGLIQLTVMDQLQATYSDCGRMTLAQQLASSYGPFSWIVAGSNLTYMAIETIVYFAIAVAIDVMLSHPALRARLLPDKDIPEARHEVCVCVWVGLCVAAPM